MLMLICTVTRPLNAISTSTIDQSEKDNFNGQKLIPVTKSEKVRRFHRFQKFIDLIRCRRCWVQWQDNG